MTNPRIPLGTPVHVRGSEPHYRARVCEHLTREPGDPIVTWYGVRWLDGGSVSYIPGHMLVAISDPTPAYGDALDVACIALATFACASLATWVLLWSFGGAL